MECDEFSKRVWDILRENGDLEPSSSVDRKNTSWNVFTSILEYKNKIDKMGFHQCANGRIVHYPKNVNAICPYCHEKLI